MDTTLPTPRQLLTQLLNTLTTTPSTPHQPPQIVNEPYSLPSNALKNLPPPQRALLTTLHVLFPPPMLLQALDLLDRGLVLRVIENPSLFNPNTIPTQTRRAAEQKDQQLQVHPPQANRHISSPPITPEPPAQSPRSEERKRRNQLYQVRSSQPPKSRFRDSVTVGSTLYTVRLKAWTCTCAAFAFSAFPGGGSFSKPWNRSGGEAGEWMEMVGIEEVEQQWSFGGLSVNGIERGGEGVPVCKHLLACLLGERWEILRSYVRERGVSREEMAGIGAE